MSIYTDCRAPAETHRGALAALAGGASAAAFALVTVLLRWQERGRQRRQLMALSGHLLKDLGLDRGDVHRETSKPFWQA